MRQSELFTKTRREAPKDEVAKNAKLLIRAGFINKEMAGAYSYLPLGLRVLKKIENIIRREMNALGGQEVFLTSLQPSGIWEKTGRWKDEVVDNWFKTTLKDGSALGLAHTHEEPLTNLLVHYASSYRDFPIYVYQFQTKFRNELRAKSGIMRGREFIMKDLYSFCRTREEHDAFYVQMKKAYTTIFDLVGIGEQTYFTYASGGSFSQASDEFQTVTEAGEDTIYIDPETRAAINEEMMSDDILALRGMDKGRLVKRRAVEVGNIFPLGTKFSQAFGLTYRDEQGVEKPVIMGSYGIGLGRLMGTVAEVLSDEDGIVWPSSIAPFAVHLVQVGNNSSVREECNNLYRKLVSQDIEVFYDDREEISAGEKFADADLIGIPYRVVVSEKTMRENRIEVKERRGKKVSMVTENELIHLVNYA
jgi:prolyl-tRNA synthetase